MCVGDGLIGCWPQPASNDAMAASAAALPGPIPALPPAARITRSAYQESAVSTCRAEIFRCLQLTAKVREAARRGAERLLVARRELLAGLRRLLPGREVAEHHPQPVLGSARHRYHVQ